MPKNNKHEWYQALVRRDRTYEGLFYVGVTTTGVFCRPTCPARKPKRDHCEFFTSAQQALFASFRPCKRCRPLDHPDIASSVVARLIQAVEQDPCRRWPEHDVAAYDVDASTARRHFKKRFGMTFVEYARTRRLGIAMKEIRNGKKIIEAQLDAGYESSSRFRDAFFKIMGLPPVQSEKIQVLSAAWIDTPLGPMVAIGDQRGIYLLEFVDRRGLEKEVERLRKTVHAAIVPGHSPVITSLIGELQNYFDGTLTMFKTPIHVRGTPFQKAVWQVLCSIPYGSTISYSKHARMLGRASACRAVAHANGANQVAIIVPCHRVVTSTGALGGYGGGIHRKRWLIDHEKRHR